MSHKKFKSIEKPGLNRYEVISVIAKQARILNRKDKKDPLSAEDTSNTLAKTHLKVAIENFLNDRIKFEKPKRKF